MEKNKKKIIWIGLPATLLLVWLLYNGGILFSNTFIYTEQDMKENLKEKYEEPYNLMQEADAASQFGGKEYVGYIKGYGYVKNNEFSVHLFDNPEKVNSFIATLKSKFPYLPKPEVIESSIYYDTKILSDKELNELYIYTTNFKEYKIYPSFVFPITSYSYYEENKDVMFSINFDDTFTTEGKYSPNVCVVDGGFFNHNELSYSNSLNENVKIPTSDDYNRLAELQEKIKQKSISNLEKIEFKTLYKMVNTFNFFNHGTHVSGIINQLNDLNLNVFEAQPGFNNFKNNSQDYEKLLKCDVINFSMGYKTNLNFYDLLTSNSAIETTDESFNAIKAEFLEKLNGIFIAAAGNDHTDTILVSHLAQIKEDYPEVKDKIILVGNLEVNTKIKEHYFDKIDSFKDKFNIKPVKDVEQYYETYFNIEFENQYNFLIQQGKKLPSDHFKNETIHSNEWILNPTSNFGKQVDIMAPGTNIYSTMYDNGYDYLSGTSMAAPMVTGYASLILEKEGKIKPEELKKKILTTNESFEYTGIEYPVLNTSYIQKEQNNNNVGDFFGIKEFLDNLVQELIIFLLSVLEKILVPLLLIFFFGFWLLRKIKIRYILFVSGVLIALAYYILGY